MSSPLVAKTIVDRRGITTTKWVRPEQEVVSTKLPSSHAAHAQGVASAVKLFEPLRNSREYAVWGSQRPLIRYHLEASTREYVSMVNDLGNLLSGDSSRQTAIVGRMALARYLERGKTDVVRALGAHRNLIDGAPHRTKSLCQLFEALLSNGITAPALDGSLRSLESHLSARPHYENSRLSRAAYLGIPAYEKNISYMQMVEDHADHVEFLLDYRRDRELDSNPDGPQPLDEADFRACLKNGVLASGTL